MPARIYHQFLDGCGLAVGLVIAALAVMITVDVTLRAFGWGNLPWLLEVAEYALYAATFAGAPWVLHRNAHVRVDIVVTALPRRVAQGVEVAMDLLGLAVSGVLIYYGSLATVDAYSLGSLIFKELIVAEWWLLWVMPFTGVLLAVEFGVRIAGAAHGGPDAPDPRVI